MSCLLRCLSLDSDRNQPIIRTTAEQSSRGDGAFSASKACYRVSVSFFMPPSSSSSSYELCRHHRRCALACVRVIVTACGACTHAVTKAALRNAACAPAQDYCRPLPAAAINLVRSPWMPACLPVCMQLYCRNGFMRPVLLRLETYM